MLSKIIEFSLRSKFLIILFVCGIIGFGTYALMNVPIGAVPDITNNQVQVITTSRNLSTSDVEQFITYPVELEMANLPGVKEIRSVSKFGLSVVTIIFEDSYGTYLPRQLISEKLKSAAKNIPSSFGSPFMGPITTGLGEIYQYTLETKPGYEDEYDARELRTIQDWIVKRQLSGIPGVVEINSWGGYLKQYEVSINTKRLQANQVSFSEVFQALEDNNSVAGGSYIEKNGEAYFIRGEGLISNLEDIKNIVVTTRGNQPIYIKDIAEVGFGHARRFGAITGNGEGEKVLGQVMMLKGANSQKVINAVKERIAQVENTLPEGVYINGFLDRSELIERTTSTIIENLFLGFLVVAFIVILIIGDWRAGLVISSIIPLSFLCAISLMYVFGVDVNLMSMGALDFGIIIDGAVIIVEFVAFRMWQRANDFSGKTSSEISKLKDKITFKGASKMLTSAIFGQIIILIVFIPILSLSGVEGKMFRPMALTFSFALIGAMILGFTWVPVACSLILKPNSKPFTFSTKLMDGIKRLYLPSIKWALDHTKVVLVSSVVLIALGVFTFTKMGGEFVPTLDEGDFVIQPILKTGKSLSSTVERTTEIENILLDQFQEVDQVVSRIGAAEVPTDPMSMQDSDVIVILKSKSEWREGMTKTKLAGEIEKALAVFPGMGLQFTQPIEMRFNELITGVRSDIAIKIYGEDLDILAEKGNEIKDLISDVEGAADIFVEKIIGLPQLAVQYKRDKIARYGLSIKDVNAIVAAGFAGKSTGVVFEGQKRFDLVVRLQETQRQGISDLKTLRIDTPTSGKIPLSEVADITYEEGPAQISRDQTKRRIVVGVNVRNSDLETVVSKIQKLVNENISLPVGYTITYGGQFENLRSAKARLKIAVPIALLLIYVLLYFALKKHRDALLIYTAIPFSAVGGVFLLWLRDMPFSISAGVGFIALFGIAVLNGIILVEYFKDILKEHNQLSVKHIIDATQDRLRAVLLTASSTALGFLPMAISTGAGAEVQRPVATVIIGGLVTSTLLTLIVLPVLYAVTIKKSKVKFKGKLGLLVLLFMGTSFSGFAQENEFETLKTKMLENNNKLKSSQLVAEGAKASEGEAFTFEKTQLFQNYDETVFAPPNNTTLFTAWGVSQAIDFPTVYGSKLKLNKVKTDLAETQYSIIELRQIKALQQNYQDYLAAVNKLSIYDSIYKVYSDFAYMAKRKFEEGESNYLEKITAESKTNQIQLEILQIEQNMTASKAAIQSLLQTEDSLILKGNELIKLELEKPISSSENLSLSALKQDQKVSERNSALAKNQLLPGISASYSVRGNSALDQNFEVYQIGINIPLLFFGDRSKIKSAEIIERAKQAAVEDARIVLEQRQTQLINQLSVQQKALDNFENYQLKVAKEILKSAKLSYKAGEIDFFRYTQSIENAQRIQLDYLSKLREYNQSIIALNYLLLN
ncbi:CusA/CzcA family heavy metal efflux RND transporter [Psychroflexus sediminis]|uniref:Cobalt-zinc-cadmium resistance protein CzcA n=1 Tax=Psychroflexus sediminis TaxID=470826 RepID=A0A1G7VMD9_9FLAO|nr:CusA/CzcA family heavy metal efflux RND transporter [Psychroflexus sediminis]SDG60992.1 cobalt-zinc-cadmium resistance protein CzcA [Psychroflexus sediminis]